MGWTSLDKVVLIVALTTGCGDLVNSGNYVEIEEDNLRSLPEITEEVVEEECSEPELPSIYHGPDCKNPEDFAEYFNSNQAELEVCEPVSFSFALGEEQARVRYHDINGRVDSCGEIIYNHSISSGAGLLRGDSYVCYLTFFNVKDCRCNGEACFPAEEEGWLQCGGPL